MLDTEQKLARAKEDLLAWRNRFNQLGEDTSSDYKQYLSHAISALEAYCRQLECLLKLES